MFDVQYLLLKSRNKFGIFTVTVLYHLFILKKYLTFPISNRNKSDDKKVTDCRNVHNPAYVFLNMSIKQFTIVSDIKDCVLDVKLKTS